jgi:glycosyltransferase involved in cell wall biosynthesis
VRKILFRTSNLGFGGAVKQLGLLASGLRPADFEVHVSALAEGPGAELLRSAAVSVHPLGWRRWFDLNPLRRLRQLVQALQPDVVHAWGLASLRAVRVAVGRRPQARLIVSPGRQAAKSGVVRDRLLRALLQRADGVVAATQAEADRYGQLGVPSAKIELIRPGVEPWLEPARGRAEVLRALHLPDDARVLACVGPLEPGKGFRDAIWTFDILKHLYENVHLLLIGEGSARPRLEQFVRSIGAGAGVHFVGRQMDVSALLFHADVVWAPSRIDTGGNVALEAMAAGRPVVAFRVPTLAEIVADGETGFLVPRGDRIGLGRQTRLLLDQPELARRMGEAGKERVSRQYSAAAMVERFMQLYSA